MCLASSNDCEGNDRIKASGGGDEFHLKFALVAHDDGGDRTLEIADDGGLLGFVRQRHAGKAVDDGDGLGGRAIGRAAGIILQRHAVHRVGTNVGILQWNPKCDTSAQSERGKVQHGVAVGKPSKSGHQVLGHFVHLSIKEGIHILAIAEIDSDVAVPFRFHFHSQCQGQQAC